MKYVKVIITRQELHGLWWHNINAEPVGGEIPLGMKWHAQMEVWVEKAAGDIILLYQQQPDGYAGLSLIQFILKTRADVK